MGNAGEGRFEGKGGGGGGNINISLDSSKFSDFDLYPSGGPCSTQEDG